MVCPICGKHIRIICSKDSHMESLSLYELNALVRRSLEQCLPDECWVQAELSDVRTNSTGHCYLEFVQKDPRSNSLIAKARGTIWANVFRLLKPYFEEATGQAFVSGIKVLVVDDEKLIVKGIRFSLLQDGMEVDCAYDGEEALNMAKANSYDMILLDVMLPKMDGFEVCQAIREFSDVPIVMLTAKGDDMDKILGLEYGADDYITKPFNILEVKARIKAIMRRTSPERAPQVQSSVIEKGDIKLDCDSRRLFINDNEINLTAREFELLEILIKNENKVYSRESLLKIVWGEDYPGDVRTVDVHVRRLREKIEANPSEPKYVHTKWGVGYYYNQK